MAWQFAITVAIGIILTATVTYRHYRSDRKSSYDFNDLLINSFGLGAALAYILLPTGWLAVFYFLRRGPVERNLFPGSNIETLLISLVGGSILFVLNTIRGYYRKYIKDEEQQGSEEAIGDLPQD